MKITNLLLWISYLGFVACLTIFGFTGYFFFKRDFNPQANGKDSLSGVVSKSVTSKFSLPMNLNLEYFFRIKDGEVLVDSYFFKIKKDNLPEAYLSNTELSETDYPTPIKGNIYSLPESETYLYLETPFSIIERSLTIWKAYSTLLFGILLSGFFLTIKFLKNCNKGLYFTLQNAIYLRAISYLAILFCLFDYGFQWLIFQEINSQLADSFSFSLNSDLAFNWKYLVFSLFLFMIAQAFTEGTKLKEEQSLTI